MWITFEMKVFENKIKTRTFKNSHNFAIILVVIGSLMGVNIIYVFM